MKFVIISKVLPSQLFEDRWSQKNLWINLVVSSRYSSDRLKIMRTLARVRILVRGQISIRETSRTWFLQVKILGIFYAAVQSGCFFGIGTIFINPYFQITENHPEIFLKILKVPVLTDYQPFPVLLECSTCLSILKILMLASRSEHPTVHQHLVY